MKKPLRGIFSPMTGPPVLKTIEHSLKNLQELIGGYISIVDFRVSDIDYCLICDDEGILKGLPINCFVNKRAIYGPTFVVKDAKPELVSLTDLDLYILGQYDLIDEEVEP